MSELTQDRPGGETPAPKLALVLPDNCVWGTEAETVVIGGPSTIAAQQPHQVVRGRRDRPAAHRSRGA